MRLTNRASGSRPAPLPCPALTVSAVRPPLPYPGPDGDTGGPRFTVKQRRSIQGQWPFPGETVEGRSVPRTVAFLNKKGGVGKTSTVHHLAGTLARRGLRVLVVDADPQARLTQGLLGPDVAEALDPRETIAAVFDDDPRRSPRPGPADRVPRAVPAGRLGAAAERLQRAAAVGLRPAPVRAPRRPGRRRRRVRPGPDRLPAAHPALGVVGAGRRGRGRRPAPGRGLRGPGAEGDPPGRSPGSRPRPTPARAASATW